jgi:hypothetical protein
MKIDECESIMMILESKLKGETKERTREGQFTGRMND